jgi:isovaleryl-CoA dehydrogenase
MNDDNEILLAATKTFARRELTPLIDTMEQTQHFPATLWQRFADYNLLGIMQPLLLNGLNHGAGELAQVIEIISATYPPAGLSYIAHCALCMHQLATHGNAIQKQHYLPDMIAGKRIGALAISEYEAGSDAMNIQTQASTVSGGYLLNGRKAWITNAREADLFIIYAQSGCHNNKQPRLTAFLINRDQKGLSIGPALNKMSMRGSNTAEVILNDCFVPTTSVLGTANQAAAIMMQGLDFERLMLASGALGIIKGCHDAVLPYVSRRTQFKTTLANMPLIQTKLADLYVAYSSSKHMIEAMTNAYQHKTLTRIDAAACYLHTAEQAQRATQLALQCFGANGLMNAFPVSRLYRDVKLYDIGGGTNEIRRLLIAREWLKKERQPNRTAHENH